MKKKFKNLHHNGTRRSLGHFLLWRLGYYRDNKVPEAVPDDFSYPNTFEQIDPNKPTVTWVNHATFIVNMGGYTILTDPMWSDRCSPLSFCGPKRRHQPSPCLEAIPKIDYVIISHNHYDHLDKKTVQKIQHLHPKVVWIVPWTLKKTMESFIKGANICELKWWQSISFGDLSFTAVPAQHFSGRGLFDKNASLWMGCVVELGHDKRFYFVGDTGYNPFDFKEIKRRFQHMDLSLIPIGTYHPIKFMKSVHVGPEEAVFIHKEVSSHLSVGGHWKTFHLSEEPMDRPPFDLYHALLHEKIPIESFRVLEPGQAINW